MRWSMYVVLSMEGDGNPPWRDRTNANYTTDRALYGSDTSHIHVCGTSTYNLPQKQPLLEYNSMNSMDFAEFCEVQRPLPEDS